MLYIGKAQILVQLWGFCLFFSHCYESDTGSRCLPIKSLHVLPWPCVFKTHLVCVHRYAGGYGLVRYTSINPASMGQENAVLILQFLNRQDGEMLLLGLPSPSNRFALGWSLWGWASSASTSFFHSQEEFLCLCWNPGTAEPGAGPGQCPPLCGYHRRTVVCMLGEEICSPVSCVAFECASTLPLPRKQTCAVFLRRNKAIGSVMC